MLLVSEPVLGMDEKAALAAVIDSGWVTMGDRVREFEQAFARLHQSDDSIAVSSCTAALHLILHALDIGPGSNSAGARRGLRLLHGLPRAAALHRCSAEAQHLYPGDSWDIRRSHFYQVCMASGRALLHGLDRVERRSDADEHGTCRP